MPRYRRQTAPATVQHVIARFVDHEFRLDHPGARAEYLRRAAKALARTDWKAIAFALMSSHVHWVFLAGSRPSADFALRLHSAFASWLNREQGRTGPVFADRHRVLICEGESAAAVVAYVHNNPVRGRAAPAAASSPWTSHRAYLGLVSAPPWLEVGLGLELCGFSDTRAGRRAFGAYVEGRSGEPRDVALSGGDLQRRRRRARTRLASPVELATPIVSRQGKRLIVHAPAVAAPDCLLRPPWPGEPSVVLRACAEARGIQVSALLGKSRVRELAEARRIALLAWTLHLRRPAIEMARTLGIASSSASELISSAPQSARRSAEAFARTVRAVHAVEPVDVSRRAS